MGTDTFCLQPTLELLQKQGIRPAAVAEIAGDASTRRFFRVSLRPGGTLVVMVYPPDAALQVVHHVRVFLWAQRHRLPVPRLRAWARQALVVEDLGEARLAAFLAADQGKAEEAVLAALERFHRVPQPAPNPPFDAALFSRELAQFLEHAFAPQGVPAAAAAFCQVLAVALAAHPYRLCHRDFHLDNLLWANGQVMAVDFQDLRQGPDTYDLVSLLRERGGSQLFSPDFAARAARRLALPAGWEQRFLACAAQRGLKALGTFLKLARAGRQEYLRLVPEVARNTLQALQTLQAPEAVREAVATLAGGGDRAPAPGLSFSRL